MMSYQIDEIIKLNDLFDMYQPLLTDKQQAYFNYYFREDYSLSEIADIMDVSRNAVHLQIKKIKQYLEMYETKLNLLSKQEKRDKIIETLESLEPKSQAMVKGLEELKKV